MGKNSLCDSCGDPSDVLFPIMMLDECPAGGFEMVQKQYCAECFQDMLDNPASGKEDEEDEEEDTTT